MTLPVFAGEWISLFDGKTMKGWTNRGNANWHVSDGTLTADRGEACLLTSAEKFENFELEVEFKAAVGTNSGVFLNCAEEVVDVVTDCYEINIAPPDNPFPTGSIVKFVRVEGQVEKEEWRALKLKVNQGTVTVVLDGKKVVDHKMAKPRPEGFIGLQMNSGQVAFRNIKVRKLG